MKNSPAFTIVELLIVVVVIGILAAISFVSYAGIQQNALAAVLKSDLKQASTQLGIDIATEGSYPNYDSAGTGLPKSSGTIYQYTVNGSATSYCLSATSSSAGSQSFHISSTSGTVQEGVCDGHTAPSEGSGEVGFIQDITSANCPTDRTMVVDARDNRTYWVQSLDYQYDFKCWMLTNLAYSGGGTNTYGDTRTLVNGTNDSTGTFTEPKYYVAAGANATNLPATPTTSTDGTGQYGYLYNWCGAMGAQTGTGACSDATAPAPDPNVSVCPAGWRLPTGTPTTGEFAVLNNRINGGLTNTDAGLLSSWLAQRGGLWSSSYYAGQGTQGSYVSGTQSSVSYVYYMHVSGSLVNSASFTNKNLGFAVRCVTT